ncbi:MAG: TIGR04222 domain-containing membrane protein [Candidatus Sericytochromatia bacterium]|nr:TIGR04222 domain-containing membrane protein [Candidatus Sericytochromatia bacterium]
MNILLNNPIANLHGSDFLRFYIVVIILTTLSCYIHIRIINNKDSNVPSIPINPDPYEIAFLKGKTTEVVKLAFLKLIQLNYVQVEDNKICFINRIIPNSTLSSLEKYFVDYYSDPKNFHDIINTAAKLKITKEYCHRYSLKLQKYNLLNSTESQINLLKWNIFGSLLLFSLGAYKLIVSLINGYNNVGFTAILMVISPLILYSICHNIRITKNGKKYLKNLRFAFKDIKKQSKHLVASDPKFLLLAGLFGVSSLAGTPYESYSNIFVSDGSGDSGSSCGGGCGGGCGG